MQILLSVMEPKTRFRAARHQCLKVDQVYSWSESLAWLFRGFRRREKLWSMSPQTLQNRFARILRALSIFAGRRSHVIDGKDREPGAREEAGTLDDQQSDGSVCARSWSPTVSAAFTTACQEWHFLLGKQP